MPAAGGAVAALAASSERTFAAREPTPAAHAATAPAPGRVAVLQVPLGPGAPRAVWVYRPSVPDASSLPVLYFLHGVPGKPSDVFGAGLARSLDAWIRAGGVPFVVAAPDGNGIQHRDTEWADAREGPDQIETYLLRKVLPAVEGSHPRDAAHRAIAGFSMGGYGAVNLALRHRDVFGQVVSIAGYFHVDDPDGMFGGNPGLIDANSPEDRLADARGLRILLLDGSGDDEPVVEGESQRFKAQLDRAGIPAVLRISAGGHSWTYVAGQLPTLERFVAAGWGRAG